MIKKALLISLLFVLCFIAFLVATIPASVVWKHVLFPYTPVSSIGIQAKAFSGTIWQGRAHVTFRHIEGVLSWNMDTLSLITGALPVEMKLDSTAGELDATGVMSLGEQALNIERIQVELSELNPFFRSQRLTLGGEFFGKNLELRAADKRLIAANGAFSWSGGDLSYPAGRSMHDRNFPPFNGKLETQSGGSIKLAIRDSEASFDIMRGTLNPGGEALWEVTRRVLDIANEPWSANSNETDVVFKIKKNIYES